MRAVWRLLDCSLWGLRRGLPHAFIVCTVVLWVMGIDKLNDDVLRVNKSALYFGHCAFSNFSGPLSGPSTDLSSPSGDGGGYQGEDDEGGSGYTQEKTPSSPIGLALRFVRRAPLYAQIVLFGVCGAFAAIGVNVGAYRIGTGRRHGGLWVLCGILFWFCIAGFISCL